MALIEFNLKVTHHEMPASLKHYVDEAEEQIDIFQVLQRKNPVPGFVPSDFELVYNVLGSLNDSNQCRGRKFCEWGSGFGVVAAMAASLDFDSVGIEVDDRLVAKAIDLASKHSLPVEFSAGSMIPAGVDLFAECNDVSWLDTSAPSGYDSLGLDPDDFHVIYAYPWPGEELVIEELFEAVAAPGTVLVTYHGALDYRLSILK